MNDIELKTLHKFRIAFNSRIRKNKSGMKKYCYSRLKTTIIQERLSSNNLIQIAEQKKNFDKIRYFKRSRSSG